MLAAGTAPGAVFDLLRQPAPYLRLCTHGEVIAQVLPLLADEGFAIDDPLRWPKGAVWVLEREGTRPVRARYLPPLALGPGPDDPLTAVGTTAAP